jgi:hypothetical protein
MLLSALVFRFSSSVASDEREASGGGEPVRPLEEPRRLVVGGRCETQSWTRRETCGLETRLSVFFEEGLVVMIMAGEEE